MAATRRRIRNPTLSSRAARPPLPGQHRAGPVRQEVLEELFGLAAGEMVMPLRQRDPLLNVVEAHVVAPCAVHGAQPFDGRRGSVDPETREHTVTRRAGDHLAGGRALLDFLL